MPGASGLIGAEPVARVEPDAHPAGVGGQRASDRRPTELALNLVSMLPLGWIELLDHLGGVDRVSEMPAAAALSPRSAYFRLGSLAEVEPLPPLVRSSPESGHSPT
jgi:hypothetical protein